MIVGSDFSEKCKKILLETERISEVKGMTNVSLEEINKKLKLDRTEIKNLFQYLSDLEYIVIESIGGPFLFGEISLTKRGITKIASLKKNKS